MNPLLLLWDIDCTLLVSGGAGEEALRQSLLNRFGIIDDLSDIEIAGRTDMLIAQDVAKKYSDHDIDPKEFLEGYLEYLQKLLPQKQGRRCPGVKEILDWAHPHTEVHNALLTGNLQRGAFLKLKQYGLDEYFKFGAFSDDSADRNQLGPIALQRARDHLKKDFRIESTWIIGDTPKDIACGRALGCKVAAVATGRYNMEQLAVYQPELLYQDLSDYKKVIADLEKR